MTLSRLTSYCHRCNNYLGGSFTVKQRYVHTKVNNMLHVMWDNGILDPSNVHKP